MGSVGCLPIFKEFLARKPRYNPIEFVGRGMVKPLRQEALVFKLLVWWVELLLYISQVFFLPDQEFFAEVGIFFCGTAGLRRHTSRFVVGERELWRLAF